MHKNYEFRLHPTKSQEQRFIITLNACRFVYNWGIEDRKNLWNYCHVSTNLYEQDGYLKHLKNEHPWLKEPPSHTLKNALRRVDETFKRFFKDVKIGKKHGYPKFKGKNQYNSFTIPDWGTDSGTHFDGKRLLLSKIGRIRINLHRPIEGQIKTCTILRRADGWYALFSVIQPDAWRSIDERIPIGIDMGLTTFATLSNGEKIENPRFFEEAEKHLKLAHRKIDKRKMGSNRRRKAIKHLALEYLHIQRARKNFQSIEAKKLTERFSPIFVENLNIKELIEHSRRSKSISDASWGQFLQLLSHSANKTSGACMAVEARGTSQECSRCGVTVKKNLSERTHSCTSCGLILDRDINAAKNILAKGLGKSFGEGAGSNRLPKTRETSDRSRGLPLDLCAH